MPLESFIKSENRIQTNFAELYITNSKAILSWLHANDLSIFSHSDMKRISKFIQSMYDDGYLDYLIKYGEPKSTPSTQ